MNDAMSGNSKRSFSLPAPALAILYSIILAAPLAIAWASGTGPITSWWEATSATGLVGATMLMLSVLGAASKEPGARRGMAA